MTGSRRDSRDAPEEPKGRSTEPAGSPSHPDLSLARCKGINVTEKS